MVLPKPANSHNMRTHIVVQKLPFHAYPIPCAWILCELKPTTHTSPHVFQLLPPSFGEEFSSW